MKVLTNSFSFAGKQALINNLLDVTGQGIIILGPEEELLFANQPAISLLSLDESSRFKRFSFSAYYNVVHEDGSEFPAGAHPVASVIRTGKPADNIAIGLEKKKGDDRLWLLVNAQPVYSSNGTLTEVICSFNNITIHKAAEEKLTALYQNLEEKALELAASNADLERFVYAATHDLQEPLRIIGSFLQLLQRKYEGQLDEMADEYIQFAVRGANHMKSLILDLLEYSGISANRDLFSTISIKQVLETVVASFARQLAAKKGEITTGPMPEITGDSSLIGRLFEHLIDNAIRYSGDRPPQIHISCVEKGGHYVFSVADNGIGIEPGYTQKIFNLFQRLHHEKDGRSTGAGLAVCKKIARLHNGNIWVTTTPGKGSTFSFNIPKKEPHHEKV